MPQEVKEILVIQVQKLEQPLVLVELVELVELVVA
jgi:hypothetical protein